MNPVEADVDMPVNGGQPTTLKVEDGIKNMFLVGLRPLSALVNDENVLSLSASCTSHFSLPPIYLSLIDIFEHLGTSRHARICLWSTVFRCFSSILYQTGEDRRRRELFERSVESQSIVTSDVLHAWIDPSCSKSIQTGQTEL